MSATPDAVAAQAAAAASGELNRPRWNDTRRLPCGVTNAFRRFASPALTGLSARSEEEAVVGRGSQREYRLARVGVDEDLVPGGGSQRRAPLTQGVRRAYQAHGVDRVVREGTVRGIGDSSQAYASRMGSAYQRAFAPGPSVRVSCGAGIAPRCDAGRAP